MLVRAGEPAGVPASSSIPSELPPQQGAQVLTGQGLPLAQRPKCSRARAASPAIQAKISLKKEKYKDNDHTR